MKRTYLKNPCHPGKALKANFEELGLSIETVAQAMRIDAKLLESVCSTQSPVTADIALRLDKVFKTDCADLYLRMQENYDKAQARNVLDTLDISPLVLPHAVA
jgi:addiction module HigA family antidote